MLKASIFGILFPVLIALLVPLRLMLNKFFDRGHLAALDADEDVEAREQEPMAADLDA